jgi:flavin reductase (DIM6/NTAB) family NADH-FMN oxidoreductase RutF
VSGTRLADASQEDGQRAAQTLRQDARRLPTGVSVLTSGRGPQAHAATVSTVSVVSQRPPTACVSLRYDSLMARLVRDSGLFVVNVLSSGQALLADWFANPQRPPGRDQFALVKWEPQEETGIPMLRGCLAQLSCRLVDHHRVGDGDGLLVAEIAGTRMGNGRPLVSFDGRLYDAELHGVARRQGWRPSETAGSGWD